MRGVQIVAVAAALIATVLLGIGLALPLRPTYSASEKRALASFPTATTETLLSGAYFTDLATWFSDTFPCRETLLSLGAKLESLYGPQGESFYGNRSTAVADTIPETAESLAPVMTLAAAEPEGAADEANASATPSSLAHDKSATGALDQYAALVETNADGTLKEKKAEKAEVNGEQAGSIYVTIIRAVQ